MASTNAPVMDRLASLTFLSTSPKYDLEKPYEIWIDSHEETNCVFQEYHDIRIKDIRDITDQFTLDSSGFEYIEHKSIALPPSGAELEDGGRHSILPYLNETLELVRDYTGASKAICFDWRFRKNKIATQRTNPENPVNVNPEDNRFAAIPPASVVHQDESGAGGDIVVTRYLTEGELDELKSYRVRIINVWRPIVSCVEDAPLAFCDRRSVLPEDVQVCDKVQTTFVGEGTYLQYSPAHQWYWWPKQSRDRPVLFVTWDSEIKNDLACPPHASFIDMLGNADAPPRESIEVRTIVFDKKN